MSQLILMRYIQANKIYGKNQWRKLAMGVALLSSLTVAAQNPIIQTSYTADPAPLVYNAVLS